MVNPTGLTFDQLLNLGINTGSNNGIKVGLGLATNLIYFFNPNQGLIGEIGFMFMWCFAGVILASGVILITKGV